ncbi:glutamine synthetase family protein [Aestuariispira insulae]|uniref:Glutamate--putrescine ligase n=1 Tax=Aestuariispira insulae TaxID=1461337 RepID=A0A3D9H6S9_9PROT|nr:glutamine synthetase family protein [Aestuariispira insulae]RED44656.1 glutamate--putrescine ligase [Aestuariispira insulae]
MSSLELKWLEANPDVNHVTAGVCDLNGILRGKRYPVEQAKKILSEPARMPETVLHSDIWGQDVWENSWALDSGDADSMCSYTGRGILPVGWTTVPHVFLPLWLLDDAGKPFKGDPRGSLAAVQERYAEKGLRPVVAMELEFYLYSLENGKPLPPRQPGRAGRTDVCSVLGLDQLEQLEGFFNAVYEACAAQGIPADTAISENGAGQYEVNLCHVADPLRAADDALFFKRLVRGIAQKFGCGATFMAKPYGDQAGSSMHVHFSLIDEAGKNLFDDGPEKGSMLMKHAVGGMLRALPEMTLIYAPHLNSYRRLKPHALAPVHVSWGYDNRTAAIRIPGGPAEARRIEHRVAGADANPYLVLAAHLGAALEGIEQEIRPGAPIDGWSYEEDHPQLPTEWSTAIDLFADGETVRRVFDERLYVMMANLKRHEMAEMAKQVSDVEYDAYLGSV